MKQHLADGKRIAHDTRVLTEDGINCLAKMAFSGGLFIGRRCYTRNFAKIRGLCTKPSVTFGQRRRSCTDRLHSVQKRKGSASFGLAVQQYGTVPDGACHVVEHFAGWQGAGGACDHQ